MPNGGLQSTILRGVLGKKWLPFSKNFPKTVDFLSKLGQRNQSINKTNDLILNLTPENMTQHSRIVTTTHKGSSTPTKMSKIIGRQIH